MDNVKLLELHSSGLSSNKIAKIMGCNPGTVWYHLDRLGLKSHIKRSANYGTIENRKDEIVSLFNNGMSAYKISKQLNIPRITILRLLRSNGCDTNKRFTGRQDKLIDHKDEIIALYNSGINALEIGRKFNAGNSSIHKLLRKSGIQTRDATIYKVNAQFFDIIDSDQKAYVLGLWYADGCTDKKGKMRLALKYTDKKLLEDVSKLLEYDGPLHYVPAKNKMKNSKPQWCLCINRKRLTDKLIERGCMPKKSMILQFPTFEQVPEEFMSAFIRGYFDGDGSISKTKSISITSFDEFLFKMNDYLKSKIGIDLTVYYRRKNKRTASSMIGRQDHVKAFLEYIYTGSTIHLDRKFERSISFFPNLASINTVAA